MLEIEALLANGSTQKFIAKRYQTTPANLSNWIKKNDIKKLDPHWTTSYKGKVRKPPQKIQLLGDAEV